MGVLASFGDQLVSLAELDHIAKEVDPAISSFVAGGRLTRSSGVSYEGRLFSHRKLRELLDNANPAKPYQAVGAGKPLSMVLEYAYLGDLPDAARFNPFAKKGDVLVTSSNRPFQVGEPAPRAIHYLKARAESRTGLKGNANYKGSPLMYYSPAVTDVSILATVEMVIDRDFDEALTARLGAAVGAAAALPIFALAAPWLIGAGVAIPLLGKAANVLANPTTFFRCDEEINISRPGLPLAEKGALILYPGNDTSDFQGYAVGRGFRLYKDGQAYTDDLPYAVMTLDGTEQKSYEGWKAIAASADVVERFFTGGDALGGIIDVVSKSLELYNDLSFQERATEVAEQINNEKDEAKKKGSTDAFGGW